MDHNGAKESIVASGTSVQGVVTSECPVTVSGIVDGELTAPALLVTESGSVSGKVTVEDLRSSGEIAGEIDAGTMQLSGTVRDKTSIRAKSLDVKLSADGSDKLQLVFGTATIEVGPNPSEILAREPFKVSA